MEPDIERVALEDSPADGSLGNSAPAQASACVPKDFLHSSHGQPGEFWIFIGNQGLRAGWAILLFLGIYQILRYTAGSLLFLFHLIGQDSAFTARQTFFEELVPFTALLGAAAVLALVQQRRSLLVFNLDGPKRGFHFAAGLAAGFLALSTLVVLLAGGGWLQLGSLHASAFAVLKHAALWGCVFLLVGCVEEGLFRCYLQSTLTRGLNFWWALGLAVLLCADASLSMRGNGLHMVGLLSFGVFSAGGNGAWGVYAVALLGLGPCVWLHLRRAPSAGFWQAAWVTSTLFGFVHTNNNGENWIGIFAAATIGFVFCVSVRLTGSAWWAIGFHAAWDWAETFFYGTADSGLAAQGSLLHAKPVGNALWSGGADGPEGSLLVLAVILLVLAALVLVYRRRMPGTAQMAA
jgi:hypothetical protein